jgi:hypothetical protein
MCEFEYALWTPLCSSVQGFSARGKFTEHEGATALAAAPEIGSEFLRLRIRGG